MTIVKNDQFESLLPSIIKTAQMILLHGSDSMVISERARRLAPLLSEVEGHVRLTAQTLSADPSRLADEALAIPLFGGRRLIWIQAGGRDISTAIRAVADILPQDTALLVEADSLKKGNPLRTLFETHPKAAAIECYTPSLAHLGQLVDTEARLAKVTLDAETRAHCLSWLATEPATARNNLEILMLYAQSTDRLTVQDVDALMADTATTPADTILHTALVGDTKGLERAARQGLKENSDAASLSFPLSQRVGLLLDIGQNGEPERLMRLPPTVRQALLAQAKHYPLNALISKLSALAQLTINTRRSPKLAAALMFRALTILAHSARRQHG